MTVQECRDKLDAAELLIIEVCEAVGEGEMSRETIHMLLQLSRAGAGITGALRCTGLRDGTDAFSQERSRRVHSILQSAAKEFRSALADALRDLP